MDRYNYQRERKISHSSNPSFSSTLLDAIYRSIDQGEEEEIALYKEAMRKKQSNNMENFQKACMIEKWMEHKVSEKVVVRRKSTADFERKSRNLMNSSSSSSDSSCGGVFSSSETESSYNNVVVNSSGSSSSWYGLNRPKPIRTSISTPNPAKLSKNQAKQLNNYGHNELHMERDFAPKTKSETGFLKTKSKALKIYGDLKKVKQPISPGGRLASFLNSLFTTRNAKKPKVSANASSTCSSASSFSRSCLSKSTPKSSSNGTKRSVRFYPVSIIVDEDCQPCGHKNLHEEKLPNSESVRNIRNSINEELKNRRVEEATKELLRNYQRNSNSQIKKMEIFDDEDDDDASCASSDLFELDNLSAIGIDSNRYLEELPVYETTHLDTNRAIANGLIL
ncbi:protein BIG GRAIN 1-like A [Solanum dulcamara]|uniref:protein BIG GRAIN 1-like A n=1 Tax=Solanum dulcamara TaxID=45834 RepID=UPI002486C15E|nr:protein BIG GRAIN 1-like A [Solanum dulcamara]